MEEKYHNLIEMCKNGIALTQDNVGDDMIFVDRGSFHLIIPKEGNTDEHGDFFINSIKGHYCYSYSDVSIHTYHILDGNGVFIIDDERKNVKKGDTIIIEPKTVYTYICNMLLIEEMEPNFKEEYEHEVGLVDYSKINEKIKGTSK